jgi:hypothetical protein
MSIPSPVQRYDLDHGTGHMALASMEKATDGDWVKWESYDSLSRKVAAYEAERDALKETWETMSNALGDKEHERSMAVMEADSLRASLNETAACGVAVGMEQRRKEVESLRGLLKEVRSAIDTAHHQALCDARHEDEERRCDDSWPEYFKAALDRIDAALSRGGEEK